MVLEDSLSNYPFPWHLEFYPGRTQPFLIAANEKLVCQIAEVPGQWVVVQTMVKLLGGEEAAEFVTQSGTQLPGFRL